MAEDALAGVATASRKTAAPSRPRAEHPGSHGLEQGRSCLGRPAAAARTRGGAVLRRVSMTRGHASLTSGCLKLRSSAFHLFALVGSPASSLGVTTQSTPCTQATPLTKAKAEVQNPEGKQSGKNELAGACRWEGVDPARTCWGGETGVGLPTAWGRWQP